MRVLCETLHAPPRGAATAVGRDGSARGARCAGRPGMRASGFCSTSASKTTPFTSGSSETAEAFFAIQLLGFLQLLGFGAEREQAVPEEEARPRVHDARLGAVVAHELIGLAEAVGGGFEVPALVREHAEGVDRVVGPPLPALSRAKDPLGLVAPLAVGDRQEVERAAHAERGEGQVSEQDAAVGVLLGQPVQGAAVARRRVFASAGELVHAAELAIHLRARPRVEAGALGEGGRALEALTGLVLGDVAAVGTAERLLEEELRVAPAPLLVDGAQVAPVEVEGALALALAKQHAADGAERDAAFGVVEAGIEEVVVHQLVDAFPVAGPCRPVEPAEVAPALGALRLGGGERLEGLFGLVRVPRRTADHLLQGAGVEVGGVAIGREVVEVRRRSAWRAGRPPPSPGRHRGRGGGRGGRSLSSKAWGVELRGRGRVDAVARVDRSHRVAAG